MSNSIPITGWGGLGGGGGGGGITIPASYVSAATIANPIYVTTPQAGKDGDILVYEGGGAIWKSPIDVLINSRLSQENKLVAAKAEQLRRAYNDYTMCVKLVNEGENT
jgi:hypothetical protein